MENAGVISAPGSQSGWKVIAVNKEDFEKLLVLFGLASTAANEDEIAFSA